MNFLLEEENIAVQLEILSFKLGLLAVDLLLTILQLVDSLYVTVAEFHILCAQSIDGLVAVLVLAQDLLVVVLELLDFALHLFCFGFKV